MCGACRRTDREHFRLKQFIPNFRRLWTHWGRQVGEIAKQIGKGRSGFTRPRLRLFCDGFGKGRDVAIPSLPGTYRGRVNDRRF